MEENSTSWQTHYKYRHTQKIASSQKTAFQKRANIRSTCLSALKLLKFAAKAAALKNVFEICFFPSRDFLGKHII